MNPTRSFAGQCHCGDIRYTLLWPQDVSTLPARRCGCDYCRRIDAIWISHPDAALELLSSARSAVSRYRFGTRTADFLFCARCGITVAAVSQIDDRDHAVVNVQTLRPEAGAGDGGEIDLDVADVCFDQESSEQRQQRRRERWIRTVVMS